jgi:putative transposase
MRLSRGVGSPAFLSITSSSKDTSPRELLLATAELRKRQQNHSKEVSITGKRLAEFLAEACAHEVLLTQRLQDVEAQDVFAQMGGVQSNEPLGNRLEEQASPTRSSPEQGQSEEKEDVYAGLEVYGEYR